MGRETRRVPTKIRDDMDLITMKGLYCDGCGLVEPSGFWEDVDASRELSKLGWTQGEDRNETLCGGCSAG